MDYEILGANIRKYRKQRNLIQEQLAEMSGISPVFMSQIETAKGKPSLETVVNIAKSLNVSIDVLVGVKSDNISEYIGTPLTREQMNLVSFAFNKRSNEEVSAMFKAFSILLDTMS